MVAMTEAFSDPDQVSGDELGDGPHGEDAMGEDLGTTDQAASLVESAAATLVVEQGSW